MARLTDFHRQHKWILALPEFELKFESAKAIKGQIIADLSPSIVIHQLICLKLLCGLCSLMDPHAVKVEE
jgi:hypothetical protein